MSIQLREGLTFSEVCGVLGASYRTVDLRALCVLVEGNWLNYGAVAFPTMREEQQVKSDQDADLRILFEYEINKINELGIAQHVFKSDDFPLFLETMQSGMLIVGAPSMPSASLRGGYEKIGQTRYEEYGLPYEECAEYPTFSLYISSNQSPSAEFTKLNLRSKLVTLGLGEEVLVERWLKTKNQFPSFNCIVAFPIYVKIEGMKYLGNKKLNLQLKVHKSLENSFSVLAVIRRFVDEIGYITLGVFKKKLALLSHREEGDFAYVNDDMEFDVIPTQDDIVDVKVVNEVLGIVIHGEYNIRSIYTQRAFEDSFLYVATRFIPLDEIEERLLNAPSKGGRMAKPQTLFEDTAAWLLSLLGFRTIEPREFATLKKDNYEVGDADLIVQDPESRKVLVVSCSLKPPRPDKIDRITNLAGHIRDHYAMVEPLMIISEQASEVKSNIRRVKVLDKSDIKQIISLLRAERIREARETVTKN